MSGCRASVGFLSGDAGRRGDGGVDGLPEGHVGTRSYGECTPPPVFGFLLHHPAATLRGATEVASAKCVVILISWRVGQPPSYRGRAPATGVGAVDVLRGCRCWRPHWVIQIAPICRMGRRVLPFALRGWRCPVSPPGALGLLCPRGAEHAAPCLTPGGGGLSITR